MKKLLFLLLLIPLTSFTSLAPPNDFIGKWKGEDQKDIGFIIFDNEGYAAFEIQGEIYGGKEFTLKGKKGSMTYEVNKDVNPIEVDLIVTVLEMKEEKKLLCIAKFIDNNTMEFAINFENLRPTEFTGENSIIFKRVK